MIKPGDRNKAVLTIIVDSKMRGLPIEEAIRRGQAFVRRLPPGTSRTPLGEQLAHVVRAAKTIYDSPDPRYSFNCDYVLAMGLPCAGAECPIFERRFSKFKRHIWENDAKINEVYTVTTLEAARAHLRRELQGIMPDGRVHVFIGGATGIGKSHVGADVLLPQRSIWLSQQHHQLNTPEKIAGDTDVRVSRFPKLGPDNCIQFERVQPLLDSGIAYQQVVCVGCHLYARGCGYLSAFRGSEGATSILATQHYHRFRDRFYAGHGNPDRPLVVFDENPLDSLRPSREVRSSHVRAYAALLRQVLTTPKVDPAIVDPGVTRKADPEALANLLVHDRALRWIESNLDQRQTLSVPAALADGYQAELAERSVSVLYAALRADFEANQRVRFVNLFESVHELLTGQAKCIRTTPFNTADGGALTFFVDRPVPGDKTVIVLDATGTAEVYAAVFGADRVVVNTIPHVANDSKLFQVVNSGRSRAYLDYDLGLGRLKDGSAPASAQTTRRMIEAIVARHPAAKFGLITYKGHIEPIKALFPAGVDVQAMHFCGQRGSNELEDRDVLIIVGTPRVPPQAVHHEAERIFGREVPFEEMADVPVRLQGDERSAWVMTKGFKGHEMRVAYDATVGAELVQAVGRSRFLNGAKTVYVLSNQPLPLPGVILIEARDLLGPGQVRRDSLLAKVEAQVLALKAEGKAVEVAALAKEFKCTVQTIYKHLRTLGNELPSRSQRRSGGEGVAPAVTSAIKDSFL